MIVSWGGTMAGRPKSWQDEFLWSGTNDPTRFLAISEAIRFFRSYGLDRFREETHQLARTARNHFLELFQTEPLSADEAKWYGSMVTIPLPTAVPVPKTWTGEPHPLQQRLCEMHGIEVPIVKWNNRMHLRVSCHLYNTEEDIAKLSRAIQQEFVSLYSSE